MAIVTADSYGIDYTGATDVRVALQNAINAQSSGTTFQLHAGGSYLCNSGLSVSANGITIDGQNAAVFADQRRTGPTPSSANNFNHPPAPEPARAQISLTGTGITVANLRQYGCRIDTYTGEKLVAVTGSPTIVSTTVQLDAQNEEVRLPKIGLDWNIRAPYLNMFMNYVTPRYARDKDGNVKFEMVASDTTHVDGDAVLSIVDDDSGAVMYSQGFTLTGTPTAYRVTWPLPLDKLATHLRITVRKATATANVITVASITAWGESEYRRYDLVGYTGGNEFSHGFSITGSNLSLIDCASEGPDGDLISFFVTGPTLHVQRFFGRCCGRQGLNFEDSPGPTLIEDSTLREVGRSGFDYEPVGGGSFDVTFRNLHFEQIRNYAFAAANTGLHNMTMENISVVNAGMGPCYMGFTGATITNFTHTGTYREEWDRVLNVPGTTGVDAVLVGSNMQINGFSTDIGIWVRSGTGIHVTGAVVNSGIPTQLVYNLGDADSSQPWKSYSGSWIASGGKAHINVGVQAIAAVETGMSDVTVDLDVTVGASGMQAGPCFRLVDNNNYILFALNGATVVNVYRKLNGVYTLIGGPYTVSSYASTTAHARVRAAGSTLQFYLNGNLVATLTDTNFVTATEHGLWSNNDTVSRFDNFSVVAA